jgi:hypothetical protein
MAEQIKAPPAARETWLPMLVEQINRALRGVSLTNLPAYDDDAAAGAGGLVTGQFYKTPAGAVMVKL